MQPDAAPAAVPWRAVAIYVGATLAAGWLVCSPLWIAGASLDALGPLGYAAVLGAFVLTPTLGAIAARMATHPRRPLLDASGLRVRGIARTIGLSALGLVGSIIALALSLVLAAAVGLVDLDPADSASQRSYLIARIALLGVDVDPAAIPSAAAAALVLLATTGSLIVYIGGALVEEIGWRGLLLPALRPLGDVTAVIVSSVAWALWHAPLVLLGFNFDDRGVLGLLQMTALCVALGVWFSWLRIRSDSVWPSAVAHGAFNAFLTPLVVVLVGGARQDDAFAIAGWTTWIAFLVVGGAAVVLGRIGRTGPSADGGARSGSTGAA